ncbi:MAG TPA: hypothetical protein VKQ32_23950 [Polyangia bacterium]|nr:hypothetical protein [Polyangia bacterium]
MLLLLATIAAASPSGGAAGAGTALREAPLLDKAKGTRAVAAYRKAINDLCDGLWSTPDGKPMRPQWDPNNYDVVRSLAPHTGDERATARLKEIGLDDADAITLCGSTDPPARPLASGSFLVAGADEVLLEVGNGATSGATLTLAIVRGSGKSYHLVTHLPAGARRIGNQFEARLRLTTRTRRDVLFLCEAGGNQGIYSSTCGFLGHGSFREPPEPSKQLPTIANPSPEAPADPGLADELTLVDVRTCGPVATVEMGKVSARGDRMFVDLVLVDAVAEPAHGEEDSAYCGRQAQRKERRFTLEYKFEDGRLRRVTPIPADVTEVLNKNL